jgi:chorismate-pyruvate lyase
MSQDPAADFQSAPVSSAARWVARPAKPGGAPSPALRPSRASALNRVRIAPMNVGPPARLRHFAASPPQTYWPRIAHLIGLAATLAASVPAYAQEPPSWPDTYVSRLQALALVQTLNAEILASRSATETLESWCRDHQLAKEPSITAELVTGAPKAPTAEQRQRLQVTPQAEVKYRRVELRCGNRILSEADNWYVPDRLTADMNRLLDTTRTPFGKVVQSLEPYRQTFAVKLLWSPLPERWEHTPIPSPTGAPGVLAIPAALFEHRAVLYTREHQPFSEVDEIYQGQLLAFPPPR